MNTVKPGFIELALKTAVVHTLTYAGMGMLAYNFLDYAARFASPTFACWMRPTSDLLVAVGPLFQPLRGLIFALVFYPLRPLLFGRKNGWLIMGWMLVGLGIFSTFGPAPGSVEGLLYTVIPAWEQLSGLFEVVPQAFLLAFILTYWVDHPARWLNWVLGIAFVGLAAMMIMGLLVR